MQERKVRGLGGLELRIRLRLRRRQVQQRKMLRCARRQMRVRFGLRSGSKVFQLQVPVRGFFFAAIFFSIACGSSGTPSGPAPTTCPEVATEICKRAAMCRTDGSGKAPVRIGITNIVYESQAFCETTFRDQCGPSTPASYVPRVGDPKACGADLVLVSGCEEMAFKLPASCGGK
jgi:hypothetical protein